MLTSRFFTTADPQEEKIILPLPNYWWSRPYEYAWAKNFAKGTVLDAACGICHPFKFWLTTVCDEVHACDWDYRILSKEAILADIRADFDEKAVATIEQGGYLEKVTLKQADLLQLPYETAQFDHVFCLSVIEHLAHEQRKAVLQQFSRILKPDGKIILTMDYPLTEPVQMLACIKDIGLQLSGHHNFQIPDNAIAGQGLKCYRMVLEKKAHY